MQNFKTILYDKSEGIATITLNRPEVLNALNWVMNEEMQAAWADIKKDPKTIVAIVTGAGDRAFCTGIDVKGMANDSPPIRKPDEKHRDLYFTAIHTQCWKPVITAINGMTVGGGLHFVADSDIVIAADHATFFDTHVKVGLVSGHEPIGLVRRMPFEAVMRMSLMGGQERMSAQRAFELGMISEVVPKDRLMARAREIAKMLLTNSPQSMIDSKKAIWGSLNYGRGEGMEYGWKVIGEHNVHADVREGSLAFVERRKPVWQAPKAEH